MARHERHKNKDGSFTHMMMFDSLFDMMSVQPSPKNAEVYNKYKNETSNPSWHGIDGGTEGVTKAMKQGWREGYERILEAFGTLLPPRLPSVKRKRRRGSYGDKVDIHAVNRGHLDRAWTRMESVRGTSQLGNKINIMVHIDGNGCMSPEEFFWRGACAIALAKSFADSGRAVRVFGWTHGTNSYLNPKTKKWEGECMAFEVKGDGQMVDYDKMATVCSLAGFFRTYIFMAMCAVPFKVNSGMGSMVQGLPECLESMADGATIVVKDVYNEEAAQEFLAEIDSKYGTKV